MPITRHIYTDIHISIRQDKMEKTHRKKIIRKTTKMEYKTVSIEFKKQLNEKWIQYWIKQYAIQYTMPLCFHEGGFFRMDNQMEEMNQIKIKSKPTGQSILREQLFKELVEHPLYGKDHVGELDDDEDAPTPEQVIVFKEKYKWNIYRQPFTNKFFEPKRVLLKLAQENKIKNYYYMNRDVLVRALMDC